MSTNIIMDPKEKITMQLVHYFITEENYTPIVINGLKDEIWLENNDSVYRIIRINCKYIHNNEQLKVDELKTKQIIKQIKKKTLSLNINALNIFLDLNDNVSLKEEKDFVSKKIKKISDATKKSGLLEYFPMIKEKIIKKTDNMDLIVNVTNDINEKTEKENKKFERIFSKKQPIVTYILIALNIIVFLSMYIFGNGSTNSQTLLDFGANYGPLVKNGEIWRLLTSAFIHIGLIHIVLNMYMLYLIGSEIESYFGKVKYLLIFIGSAIMGSLLSIVFSNSISAGASGAIFGLMGALLYFGYYYRLYLGSILKSQITTLIIINLLFGFMMTGIDNAAHIGGLIGGLLLAMASGIQEKKNKKDQINGIIVFILLFIFLVYINFFR